MLTIVFLYSHNILLYEDGHAVVADFGGEVLVINLKNVSKFSKTRTQFSLMNQKVNEAVLCFIISLKNIPESRSGQLQLCPTEFCRVPSCTCSY